MAEVGSDTRVVGRPFVKGERRTGRAKGTPNKVTRELRALLSDAATGALEAWPGGARGYMRWLAKNDPRSFTAVLKIVVPRELDEASVNVLAQMLSARDHATHVTIVQQQPVPAEAKRVEVE